MSATVHVKHVQLRQRQVCMYADMSNCDAQEVDPPVVVTPPFGVVGSGSILLSQQCNKKS